MRKKYIITLIDDYEGKTEIFAIVKITEEKKQKMSSLLNNNPYNQCYYFKEIK